MEKLCYYCEENLAEFECTHCGLPTCEDCLVEYDLFNNLMEDTICKGCNNSNEFHYINELEKEHELERQEKIKRDKVNYQRRANYWLPDNVEKRKRKKILRQKEKVELARNQLQEASKVFQDLFGGMF